MDLIFYMLPLEKAEQLETSENPIIYLALTSLPILLDLSFQTSAFVWVVVRVPERVTLLLVVTRVRRPAPVTVDSPSLVSREVRPV